MIRWVKDDDIKYIFDFFFFWKWQYNNTQFSYYDISMLNMSTVMSPELMVVLECEMGFFQNISLSNPLIKGHISWNLSG